MRVIELPEPDAYQLLGNLCTLLLDAVANGASVNFMAGLKPQEAEAFWLGQLEAMPAGRTHVFAAMEGSELLGCVLLHPCWQPNQPHRADVSKLLVRSKARRRGIATVLMEALEARALALGRTLLTLDTVTGSGAEPFYQGRGYRRAGVIPGYCLMPDGALAGTSIYHKDLAGS